MLLRKNPLILIVVILFFSIASYSQVKDSIQAGHVTFFKMLADNGGHWEAVNPKYDSSNAKDFKTFILSVNQLDSLSIDAEILGINSKDETIKFWTFSEFYAPDKQKNIFYQRSTNGLYYAIGEATMSNTERFCEMTFFYSGGPYLKHKDKHRFISQNEMESISYDYDDATAEWKQVSTLIWYRKH